MNNKRLYVGNLNYSVTKEELEELFKDYGEVVYSSLIKGKGFGFIELSSNEEAEKAKEELNGSEFRGRKLRIDEARPKREDRDRKFNRNRY